jgi:uncharacterized membrane protein
MSGEDQSGSEVDKRSADDTKGLERIVFFSDAILAIVMTLLVLDIPVPDLPPDLPAAELPAQVLALWPKFFSYVLSILVIGIYWIAHHQTFLYINSYDRTLMWLNLLFLLSITFVPFPTSLLGEYGDLQFAVVLYASSLALPRLLLALQWWYAPNSERILLSDALQRLPKPLSLWQDVSISV